MAERRLVVAMDHRFVEHGGEIFTDLAFDEVYWRDYLGVFDIVQPFARVNSVMEVAPSFVRADGPGIEFIPAPYFVGPRQFAKALPALLRSAWRTSALSSAFLLRNGTVSSVLWMCLELRRKGFAREVQGDQLASLSAYAQAGSRRPLSRAALTAVARAAHVFARVQAKRAVAVSYVGHSLRSIYPARSSDREFVFSSVRLDAEALEPSPPIVKRPDDGPRLLSIGRLEPEKGHVYLLEALASLSDQGQLTGWQLDLVGPGSKTANLQQRADELGIESQVRFHGSLPHGPRFYSLIDAADLYVLPSVTEGVPRSLIEVMARRKAAVATRVGGVPNLLPDEALCPAKSAEELATVIARFIGDDMVRNRAAQRNRLFALENYGEEAMAKVKHDFWNRLRTIA